MNDDKEHIASIERKVFLQGDEITALNKRLRMSKNHFERQNRLISFLENQLQARQLGGVNDK